MQRLITGVLVVVLGAQLCTVCVAQEDSRLYRLARFYQTEAETFRQGVLRVRGIDRTDQRSVDRWVQEARRLPVTARNPRHFNRLFYQWRDTQLLQSQIETAIFGKYTPHPDLLSQWDRVLYAQAYFAEEFYLRVESPGDRRSVQRLDQPSSRRENYLGRLPVPPFGRILPSGTPEGENSSMGPPPFEEGL